MHSWKCPQLSKVLYEDVASFLVTEKVRAIVEREGFTGVAFTPVEEYTDSFPHSRARRPA